MTKAEELESLFKYRAEFDPHPIRNLLGLDSESATKSRLPGMEIVRLGLMLKRGNYLSSQDLEKLRKIVPAEDNPLQKRICPDHGDWYYDNFGCMHHDHTNPHHTDIPPIDRIHHD